MEVSPRWGAEGAVIIQYNFFRNIQFKKLIQKFKFSFIQFNKIFIQLENHGIRHH